MIDVASTCSLGLQYCSQRRAESLYRLTMLRTNSSGVLLQEDVALAALPMAVGQTYPCLVRSRAHTFNLLLLSPVEHNPKEHIFSPTFALNRPPPVFRTQEASQMGIYLYAVSIGDPKESCHFETDFAKLECSKAGKVAVPNIATLEPPRRGLPTTYHVIYTFSSFCGGVPSID